ncbi:Pogo transposable element with KRAB domain [Mizuhopecten yessoensis]|uniref:Pogo transposable element with KRAB domain n=1 Tax=Mizuhopecten yessoensis TaxID=6573 RepID=A0A210QKQ7_MIZYE|nr:Pogo transposable element with KRAB domain [Mizuhopecten yessoensis]
MACVNAAGTSMPPMLIVKGKIRKSLFGYNTAASPQDSVWTYHERAWMNEELGEEWFRNVFLRHCGQERPQLLILDGHGSHETLGLLELAKQENISIIALPPHTTHYLQPLDRSVFGPFNKAYNKACSNFLSLAPCNIINKWTFPQMFTSAWEAGLTVQNIISGFRGCGIYPFNPAAVPKSAFLPSTVFDRPLPSATITSGTVTSSTNTTDDSVEPLAVPTTLPVAPPSNVSLSTDTRSTPGIFLLGVPEGLQTPN